MSAYQSDAFSIVPSRWILSFATFITQLLGIVAFLMAATWMLAHGHRSIGVIAVALFGALSVFAGGNAYRGSMFALTICAGCDLVIAVVCLMRSATVMKFAEVPTTWAAPQLAGDLNFAMSITSVVGLVAAVFCIVAVPQTRRYLAWHRTQMTLAPPIW